MTNGLSSTPEYVVRPKPLLGGQLGNEVYQELRSLSTEDSVGSTQRGVQPDFAESQSLYRTET